MATPEKRPFNHRHAGFEVRNGFLPPEIPVHRVRSMGTSVDLPPVPLLTNLRGEEIPDGKRKICLGYTDTGFVVRANIAESAIVAAPDCEPDDPTFWKQDHIEFRVLPDPTRDLDQAQVVLAAGGKVLVNGPNSCAEGVLSQVEVTDEGWTLEAHVPFSCVGLRTPQPGDRIFGLLAHCRWGSGSFEPACCTAAQLGFPHAERFAQFVIAADVGPVSLETTAWPVGPLPAGVVRPAVTVRNHTQAACSGALSVTCETAAEVNDRTQSIPCTLSPGDNVLVPSVTLARPLYSRLRFRFVDDGGRAADLGAITLRAGVPRQHGIDVNSLGHPYLHFNEQELADLRSRAALPVFEKVAAQLSPQEKDFASDELPGSMDDFSLELRPNHGNWFRVCRESLLRDGANARKPSSARIWSLLSEEGKQAARQVVDSVSKDQDAEASLLDALNTMLARPDFYDAEAFANVAFDPAARAELEDPNRNLDERRLFLNNRKVFQGAVECVHQFGANYASTGAGLFNKWILSGDQRVIDAATRYIEAADQCMILDPHINLHTSGLCGSIGLAYDAFAPHLREDQRAIWCRVAKRLLDLYLDSSRYPHWDCVSIPNANPVANGGGGQLGLALLNEYPEEAAEAVWHARRNIWNWLDYCCGTRGGNTEGVQYWQYGTLNFLCFARALEHVTGSDDGLLSHPAITKTLNMIRVSLSNDGATHGINDTIPVPVGAPIAYFCAGRYNDPFALWYGDHAERTLRNRREAGKPAPYSSTPFWSLLTRPGVPESFDQPDLPTTYVLDDIHYGILRSAPQYDCALVAGMKGSRAPYTHHNQPDTGAFYIHVRGERLLIDPGYYKGQPDCHNLPLIGGTAPQQPTATTGLLSSAEAGTVRVLSCNAAAAYRGAASRVLRHLVMLGDQGLVLLDDIAVPSEMDPHVLAQLQCGGQTQTLNDARTVLNQGEIAQLRIDALSHPDLRFELKPERDLKDIHWGYSFADCKHFPVTATYQADPDHPLVLAFQDAGEEAEVPSVQHNDGRLTVRLHAGPSVSFLQTAHGWMPDLPLKHDN